MPDTYTSKLQIRALGAAACSLLSASLALFYIGARAGFGVEVASVAGVLGLAWCLISLPYTAHSLLESRGHSLRWYQREGFIALSGIVITAALGRVTVPLGSNANWILFSTGLVAFVWSLRDAFRQMRTRRTLVVLVCVFLYAVWLAGVEWANGYLNPLFVENLILRGGDKHVDTLFLTSLGNMLNTYGVPSTGWDGVPFTAYHFGSSWVFAQWSNLVDLSVVEFYQVGAAVVLVPLFLRGLLIFASEVREKFFPAENRGPAVVFAVMGAVITCATIAFIPPSALNSAAVWDAGPFLSESYVFALTLAMLSFSLVASFGSAWARTEALLEGQSRWGTLVFVLLFLPLASGAIGVSKVSIMLLILAAGLHLIIRFKFYRVPVFLAAALLVAIASLWVYSLVVWSGLNSGFQPLSFLRYAVKPTWWPFFFILHLFWTWVYIILRLKQEGAGTMADVGALLRQRKIIDVEIVLVFAFIGLLPGLLIDSRSDVYYFSDVQRWLAVGLLLSNPALLLRYLSPAQGSTSFARTPLNRFVGGAALAVVTCTVLLTVASWGINLVHTNFATRRALQDIAGTRPTNSLAREVFHVATHPATWFKGGFQGVVKSQVKPLVDNEAFAKALQSRDRYPVVNALLKIGATPMDERRVSLVYIDPSLDAYWKFLPYPRACQFSVMIGPALSATALLDGVPAGCDLDGFYGSEVYREKPAAGATLEGDPNKLCTRAVKLGFSKVIEIESTPGKDVRVLKIACSEAH